MTDTTQPITAFKGLDKNFQCRGFQYAVGETYTHKGEVVACNSGFHACENPLDVLDYYPLDCDTRFAIVKASGSISRDGNKLASASIAIEAELKLPEFIAQAINYVKAVCNQDKAPDASGYYSKLAASGYSSQLAASGDYSIAVGIADNCIAKAGEGGCIALSWTKDKRPRLSVAYVGENGIKADTYYKLDEAGEFVEVEA